jgi:hypothetical protein
MARLQRGLAHAANPCAAARENGTIDKGRHENCENHASTRHEAVNAHGGESGLPGLKNCG